MTILANAPYLNVSAGVNQKVNEGTSVTLTGSFLDPDDADTHTYDWSVVASSGQGIPDGSGLSFTFTPGNAGTYTVTFTVRDPSGESNSAQVVVTSLDVPPVLSGPTAAQTAYAGASQSFNLGTLATTGVGPFTDTIHWGDGRPRPSIPTSSGSIALAHTYATAGNTRDSASPSPSTSAAPGTTSVSEDVSVASTSTTLATSSVACPTVYGQSAILTATVAGSDPPAGTVTFYAGEVTPADQIGTGTLGMNNSVDTATFNTSMLPVSGSPYVITAVYDGNPDNLGSTSKSST